MNDAVAQLLREGMMTVAAVGGPLFAAMFVVGLAMGVAQAATQVNDPAVGFIPRVLVAAAVIVGLGSWMAERLAAFLRLALERMAGG